MPYYFYEYKKQSEPCEKQIFFRILIMIGAHRVNFEHMDDLNLVYNDGVVLYQLEKDYKEYNFRCYDMYIDQ